MSPAALVDDQFRLLEGQCALVGGKASAMADLVVNVSTENNDSERWRPHPDQAAAAPSAADFIREGPVIATGAPALQGIQVRLMGYWRQSRCVGALYTLMAAAEQKWGPTEGANAYLGRPPCLLKRGARKPHLRAALPKSHPPAASPSTSPNPTAPPQTIDNSADMAAHISLNERVVDFETAIFKGKMLLSVRGVPTTPAAAKPGGPLACGRRTCHIAVQGSFKRPIAAADVVCGQEFPKAPRCPS